MAGNYWTSSHRRRWIFEPHELRTLRAQARGSFSEAEAELIDDRMMFLMREVGVALLWRAPVVATAKTLYKRFYTKASLEGFDPRLIAVTALYMGAKIEELGQYNLVRLLNAVNKVVKENKVLFPTFSPQHVHDFEFHILSKLGFDLVIFHPFRYIEKFCRDAAASSEVFRTSWDLVNDSYLSDVILIHPPYLIALAAMYIACVHHTLDLREWFNRLNVNFGKLKNVMRDLTDLLRARERGVPNAPNPAQLLKKLQDKYQNALDKQGEEHATRKRKREEQAKLESRKK